MLVLSLLCFVVGGLIGWFASRKGGWIQKAWPVVLRIQILLTSATLSLVAAWRLTALGQVVGPLVLAGAMWLLLVVAVVTRAERSPGEAMLESWAVGPNSGFWVVPVATAFADGRDFCKPVSLTRSPSRLRSATRPTGHTRSIWRAVAAVRSTP